MPPDADPDSLKETPAPYAPPPETQRLIEELYRDDVRAVLSVKRDQLDWACIAGWCQRHGMTARLDEIRRTVPDI